MISVVEPQPAGADLVAQVEEIFSPNGILSRAKNFEYPPAAAGDGRGGGAGVAEARSIWPSRRARASARAWPIWFRPFCSPSRSKKKAVISTHTINLQEQLTEKDLPMLAACWALPDR